MVFCNVVATKFDRTFKNYLRYANSNRGNASKELIDVVCRGNFLFYMTGVMVFAFGFRESHGSRKIKKRKRILSKAIATYMV